MGRAATPTEQVVELIKAENLGGPNARAAADKILCPDFLGITRAKGAEQARDPYLQTVEDAEKPESNNPLRWLDIADRAAAPDLAEPIRGQGGPMMNPNSGEWIFGDMAIVKAVVTTRKRGTPDQIEGRYRNIYVFARRGEAWCLLAWQVTGNVKWGGPGTLLPPLQDLPSERMAGDLEVVATFDGPMPTGVTASEGGRIFVNFPRWGDDVPFTVAEIVERKVDGEIRREAVPYPNAAINEADALRPEERLISVQSVVVDPVDRLWILDTGRPEFRPAEPGGPKLVGVDLTINKVFRTVVLPPDVALPTSYLNDVRFDLRRGEAGMAFITDSSPSGDNALIVVDLASGKSWRRLAGRCSVLPEKSFLPIVEGRPLLNRPKNGEPSHMIVGADGIAIQAGGERLFYRPLSGRGLFSVALAALADPNASNADVAATVEDHGNLGFASDGLEADDAGRLYLTNYEDNAILRRGIDGALETLVHDPRVLWPDTLALAADGYLYFTANQLHRQPDFNGGKDLREKPYVLFRVQVHVKPVRLRVHA